MPFLDGQRICSETFVQHVEQHEELASTNTRALEIASQDNVPLPLLVVCERQTQGRGRGSNSWWSAEGSLTFSLLIDAARSRLPVERFPRVSLAAGVAVCEAVQTLLPANRIGLKWPNDVHLDGRKACGILVESPARSRLVVGVGLNVNNSLSDAPDDVRERATSLLTAAGVEFDREHVLVSVLLRLNENLRLLLANEAALAEKWQGLSVLTGRRVELDLGSSKAKGICRRIDADGALVLENGGIEQRFYAGVAARIG